MDSIGKILSIAVRLADAFDPDEEHELLQELIESFRKANIKPGEPFFIIRGQDVAAPDAIDKYREAAAFRGAGLDFQQHVWEQAREFREWQRLNAKFVKIPD